MLIPEPEPKEKAIVPHLLAIDDFAEHGAFPFRRRNLCPLTHTPRVGGLQPDSVGADVVGKRSLAPLPSRASQRREIHFHHDRQSSFFSAVETALRAHFSYTLAQQLESCTALQGWWTLSEKLFWADLVHGRPLGVATRWV